MSYQQQGQLAAFSLNTQSQVNALIESIKANVQAQVKEGQTYVDISDYNVKFSPTQVLDYPDGSVGTLLADTIDKAYEVIGEQGNFVRLQNPAGYALKSKEVVRISPDQKLQRKPAGGSWVDYPLALHQIKKQPKKIAATISNLYDVLLYGGSFGGAGTGPKGDGAINGSVNDWLGLKLDGNGVLSVIDSTSINNISRWGAKDNLLDWRGNEKAAAADIIKQTKDKLKGDNTGPYAWLRKMGVTIN